VTACRHAAAAWRAVAPVSVALFRRRFWQSTATSRRHALRPVVAAKQQFTASTPFRPPAKQHDDREKTWQKNMFRRRCSRYAEERETRRDGEMSRGAKPSQQSAPSSSSHTGSRLLPLHFAAAPACLYRHAFSSHFPRSSFAPYLQNSSSELPSEIPYVIEVHEIHLLLPHLLFFFFFRDHSRSSHISTTPSRLPFLFFL